jgi:hypothetical protein
MRFSERIYDSSSLVAAMIGRFGLGPMAELRCRESKATVPLDLTGYWVSVVTEDWRYRMVTRAPGDYEGVPMIAAVIKNANDSDLDETPGERPCLMERGRCCASGKRLFAWLEGDSVAL